MITLQTLSGSVVFVDPDDVLSVDEGVKPVRNHKPVPIACLNMRDGSILMVYDRLRTTADDIRRAAE